MSRLVRDAQPDWPLVKSVTFAVVFDASPSHSEEELICVAFSRSTGQPDCLLTRRPGATCFGLLQRADQFVCSPHFS